MKTAICSVLAALVLCASGADWPQFRGPGGRGVSQEKDLPVKWGKAEGIRWKADLPGRGLSNPVIAGGRVYVTACSAYKEKRLHVLCFDEATGKKLWERQFTATGGTQCHPDTNMAAPTPVTDGKAVYALFATGDLAALSKEGDLLWYRSLVGDYPDITNQVGMASSPVLADGVLCVPMDNAADSFAAGLDPKTGKNLWKIKRANRISWITPAVIGGKEPAVLFLGEGEATALDPKTGKERWTIQAAGLSSIPSPTFAGGVLYVPKGGFGPGLLRAYDLSSGKPKERWEAKGVSSGFSSPLAQGGRVYGLAGDIATCFDAQTGKEVWRQRLEGPFEASPIVADGKMYAVNKKGRTFVVQLGDKPKVLSRNDLGATIQATPAVAGGCLYLRSDKNLWCLGSKK